jgi:hypothetical protein
MTYVMEVAASGSLLVLGWETWLLRSFTTGGVQNWQCVLTTVKFAW